MATIDELVIQIKADVKDLNTKMNKVNAQLGKVGKDGKKSMEDVDQSSQQLGATLASMRGKLLAVAAGLFAVGKTVSSIARVGSEFQDLRDSLDTVFGGIEAGGAAMDRVVKFAQTTPFQVETVTKAFISLQSAGVEPTTRMLQTFADTASVSVDQLGVFEALVRTVQRSASGGLGLEELNMIMDRGIDVLGILNEELGLTKMEIADFGQTAEGAKLITDALIEGLNKKFGGAMETKMDNLSTATSNMQISFKNLQNEVFESGLGTFLTDLTIRITEMSDAIVLASRAARGVGTGVAFEATELGKDATPEQKRKQEIQDLEKFMNDLIARQDELQKKLDESATRITGSGRVKRVSVTGLVGEDRENALKTLSLIEEAILDTFNAIELLEDSTTSYNESQKETIMEQGALLRGFRFVEDAVVKSKGNVDDLAFAQENLTRIYKDNEEAFLKLGVTYDDVVAVMDKVAVQSGKVASISEDLAQAISTASQTFTKDFVDSLLEGENALDSFKNFSKNIVSQIISIFLQLAVVNKILNAIFGAGSFDEFNFSTGQIDRATRASGGTVQPNSPVLVGERGPEIFIPNTGGTVLNNMNSRNAMGGGGDIIINQNLNFSTGVQSTVRSEVIKLLPTISEVTKASVMDSATRGGNFAKAIRG